MTSTVFRALTHDFRADSTSDDRLQAIRRTIPDWRS